MIVTTRVIPETDTLGKRIRAKLGSRYQITWDWDYSTDATTNHIWAAVKVIREKYPDFEWNDNDVETTLMSAGYRFNIKEK